MYTLNRNIKMSSFKSSEKIQKKEGGPDRSLSDNPSSSVTLNELAMKARNTAIYTGLFNLRNKEIQQLIVFVINLQFYASW